MIIRTLNKIIGFTGFQVTKKNYSPELSPDMKADSDFFELFNYVSEFTMTSPERLFALYHSVKYTIANGLAGDFVECGVWRGGSSMMIAYTLQKMGVTNRNIYLYDTYEGMSQPTHEDKDIDGGDAATLLANNDKDSGIWAYATLEDVKKNMAKTGYPAHYIHYIKGKVEETIPASIPNAIALLRLDTDWYESTKHELNHLFPLVCPKGVIIIDDFGHWQGTKKAVLEFLHNQNWHYLLSRIDYTGRLFIK